MDLIHEDETPTMDLIHEDDTVKTVALIQDGSEKKVVEVSSSALTVVKNILDIKFLKNPVMILIALVQFLFFLLLQVGGFNLKQLLATKMILSYQSWVNYSNCN